MADMLPSILSAHNSHQLRTQKNQEQKDPRAKRRVQYAHHYSFCDELHDNKLPHLQRESTVSNILVHVELCDRLHRER